ncbi:hypothetical protein NDU88_004350 [Pleurodeles waltl]|uniref:Uncharacterized protein n=1 Tax=Pleurodeles waltl TaxID=8319 RepID=A0AAV7QC14_PLEWA|nr:hypothetical protein NDU88_004350 [Pleurodeles waltl]
MEPRGAAAGGSCKRLDMIYWDATRFGGEKCAARQAGRSVRRRDAERRPRAMNDYHPNEQLRTLGLGYDMSNTINFRTCLTPVIFNFNKQACAHLFVDITWPLLLL